MAPAYYQLPPSPYCVAYLQSMYNFKSLRADAHYSFPRVIVTGSSRLVGGSTWMQRPAVLADDIYIWHYTPFFSKCYTKKKFFTVRLRSVDIIDSLPLLRQGYGSCQNMASFFILKTESELWIFTLE